MNDFVLREATDDEAPGVVAVLHAAFAEYDGRLEPPSGVHRETAASIREKMRFAGVALALADGQIVGCVMYRPELDHVYLGRLAVLPAYRNRGIAGALIAYVEQRARDLGLPRVRLGVRIALPYLRDRYERLGYRLVEERRHEGYSRPTYLIMEKTLHETRRQGDKETAC